MTRQSTWDLIAAARERAQAALDAIDTADDLLGTHSHGKVVNLRKERAYGELAGAMDTIYGPLPPPVIVREKRPVVRPVEDTETDCGECQGTGLGDGPDGPPCEYCNGTGIW